MIFASGENLVQTFAILSAPGGLLAEAGDCRPDYTTVFAPQFRTIQTPVESLLNQTKFGLWLRSSLEISLQYENAPQALFQKSK
jgi:hypothetical protein